MKLVNDKFRFKSGGLYEKHVVAYETIYKLFLN